MPPDPELPSPLLGGLTPRRFMQRHWQKKPLLVRGAVEGGFGWASRSRLAALARQEEVESRLVVRDERGWRVRPGPLGARSLPPWRRPGWTLLVQGVDLHWPEARALLDRFRFVPDARLDDLMISYATDRGGVGPHLDSYDVFLLQAEGRRQWRIGPVRRPERLVEKAPLKLLADFVPTDEWTLDAGDMLYLPPGWGHDGIADGACMTCSIGFRAPTAETLGTEVLQRFLDALEPPAGNEMPARRYADPRQPAVDAPARLPETLQRYAAAAVARRIADRDALACALGELLSEPKPQVRFQADDSPGLAAREGGIVVDRRSRMLYDDRFVYLNGEAFRASGRDATLIRRLADARRLSAADRRRLGGPARELVDGWIDAGWLQPANDEA